MKDHGSLTEKMKDLKSISINSDEEFVLKVKHNGILVASTLISISELKAETEGTKIGLRMINPDSIDGKMTITELLA